MKIKVACWKEIHDGVGVQGEIIGIFAESIPDGAIRQFGYDVSDGRAGKDDLLIETWDVVNNGLKMTQVVIDRCDQCGCAKNPGKTCNICNPVKAPGDR